jgi:uncharacterized protein DUF6064
VFRGRLTFGLRRDAASSVGVGLLILALTIYPVLASHFGRPWQQAEVFGVAPDPTAIVTLGLLLLTEGTPHWGLLPLPTLWCLISGATLLAMGSSDAWVPPLAGLLALAASTWSGIERRRSARLRSGS